MHDKKILKIKAVYCMGTLWWWVLTMATLVHAAPVFSLLPPPLSNIAHIGLKGYVTDIVYKRSTIKSNEWPRVKLTCT